MARYRALERFYKRGEFLAAGDEIHLHVLPDENAFVVNVFNLSDQSRRVEGIFPAGRLPVDPDRWYTRSGKWCGFATSGDLRVDCSLPAWGTAFMEFHSVPE
jgi:hypothetical protein